MTAPTKTDLDLVSANKDALLNSIARDCRQPGCRAHAGWILRGNGVAVALCTEHAARRIRRRAMRAAVAS